MRLALLEARLAGEAGDVPIGAVLIDTGGRLITTASNRVERDHNPVGHAEILALTQAAEILGTSRLDGCILVVTLEPCLMCVGAISHSRIDGVVFGAADRKAGALISAADHRELPLAGRGFWHMGGIGSQESAELLINFFKKRRPRV